MFLKLIQVVSFLRKSYLFSNGYLKYSFVGLISLTYLSAKAQSFSGETGIITDRFGEKLSSSIFKIKVDNLSASLNEFYGFEEVCLHIKHARPTDLKIELVAPDGTGVWLTNRNGISNTYGYFNTCFKQKGFNGPIHNGVRYFKGEHSPEGRIEFFNNNQIQSV